MANQKVHYGELPKTTAEVQVILQDWARIKKSSRQQTSWIESYKSSRSIYNSALPVFSKAANLSVKTRR
jgi:hypothetical protein